MGGFGDEAKGKHSYQNGGSLAKPTSIHDLNEDSWSINQMPDNEVEDEFEKMLENMNLQEDQKVQLQKFKTLPEKRAMLTMNLKNHTTNNFNSPADFIQYLKSSDLSLEKKLTCIESLRVALTNNSLEWVQEFGTKGLKQVLSLLNECFTK